MMIYCNPIYAYMTKDELKGFIKDIATMCTDEHMDGILVIALYDNGTSKFCATGSDSMALADSAANAAEVLYTEKVKNNILILAPPSLLLH
jgi:hypothetical protein